MVSRVVRCEVKKITSGSEMIKRQGKDDSVGCSTHHDALAKELIRDVEVFNWRHAAMNVDVETWTRGC